MQGNEGERRKHRRLPIKLTVLYQTMDSVNGGLQRGDTLNVSTGGLLMETCQGRFSTEIGGLMKIDLEIPPTDGLYQLYLITALSIRSPANRFDYFRIKGNILPGVYCSVA